MLLGFIYNMTAAGRDDPADPPLEECADATLMARYRDHGDVEAFEELVSRHEDGLLNFIARSVPTREHAEDILQEVFVRVVKAAPDWEPKAKVSTWIYTIARNLCIDRARRQKGKTTYSLDRPLGHDADDPSFVDRMPDEDADSASVDHDRRTFRDQLAAALDELSDKQREVFVLREFSGLKYREIADVVDAKVATVKSRMRYALEDLRGHLADWKEHSFDHQEAEQMEVDR